MTRDNLGLIVLENAKEFGEKLQKNLNIIRNNDQNYIIPFSNSRFNNGEGKVVIGSSVREKDLYILSDVGNYSINYKLHGTEHEMSPDEHFQDIKRVISATCGHASKITVIMPLLYQSRQHKRKGRESLDCAIALQELERLVLIILLLLMLTTLMYLMQYLDYLLIVFIQHILYLVD